MRNNPRYSVREVIPSRFYDLLETGRNAHPQNFHSRNIRTARTSLAPVEVEPVPVYNAE